jgi:exosortase
LTFLERHWRLDPQYSHGYLVPVFSLVLLWLRRNQFPTCIGGSSRWWGIPALVAGLGLYVAGAHFFVPVAEDISLIPVLAGLCLLLGGWALLKWAGPAIAFLCFLAPLPYGLQTVFSARLQGLSTSAATFCLQTLGYPAYNVGTDIHINETKIGVVTACSGLSMLMTFFAISTAVILVTKRPWWERLVILVCAVPIAIVSNVTRVTSTAMLFHATADEQVHRVAHDFAGLMMMVVGLLLLGIELKYLKHLFPIAAAPAKERALSKPAILSPALPGRSRARASRPAGPKTSPAFQRRLYSFAKRVLNVFG